MYNFLLLGAHSKYINKEGCPENQDNLLALYNQLSSHSLRLFNCKWGSISGYNLGIFFSSNIYTNRLVYVIADENNIYILHACRKQKGKAEKHELETAKNRANELGKELNKKFV